jgi:hypothetical protein
MRGCSDLGNDRRSSLCRFPLKKCLARDFLNGKRPGREEGRLDKLIVFPMGLSSFPPKEVLNWPRVQFPRYEWAKFLNIQRLNRG